jgi:hypothetical protein
MTSRHLFANLVVLALALGGCESSATVGNFALCNATTDTCPSATSCQGDTDTSPTFCTRTCDQDSDCPNDPTGAPGVCVQVAGATSATCFQTCSGFNGTCPDGETCTQTADHPTGSPTNACELPTGT